MNTPTTILIVTAHPDDEVLGCGGTITRLAREGNHVHIAILGEGITSRSDRRHEAEQHRLEELHARSRQAAELLGAKNLTLHNLPDNRFDTIPLLEVVQTIEQEISRLKPQIIYTHHGGDLNIDHQVVHRAVLTAARPVPGQQVREIFAFEVLSSTEWAFQRFEPSFRPNVFVDIADTLDVKIRALELYESETRDFPHPRSPEALQALARRWGSVVGCTAAEAFELIRAVR